MEIRPVTLASLDRLEADILALEAADDRAALAAVMAGVVAGEDRLDLLAALAERLPGPAFLKLFLSGLEALSGLTAADWAALFALAADRAAALHHLGSFLVLVGDARGERLRRLAGDAPPVTQAFRDALADDRSPPDDDMRMRAYAALAGIGTNDIQRFRERLAAL